MQDATSEENGAGSRREGEMRQAEGLKKKEKDEKKTSENCCREG